jgi:glutathione S-transferase
LETSPSQLPIRFDARLDLVWTNPEAFEAAVRGFIAEQRVRYAILAGQLAARGYLTADEASKARLNLRIFAQDARTHDRTPLPKVSDWAKDPPPL